MIYVCKKCGDGDDCIIIINDDASAPEYCPWDGKMDECDWNVMVEKHE